MKHRSAYKRLTFMLRVMRILRIGEWQTVVIQAVLMGLAGALAALCFTEGINAIQWLYTGKWCDRVRCFTELPTLWRLLLPALGAIPAALVLWYALRHNRKPVPDYMEAFSLGDGRLARRQGVLRCLSAALSIGSGACIGRAGALIQISAVAASAAGRWLHVSPPRLRLMVGCGAAAGFTAGLHTPLAACLFVCEIVVGTFSIGTLAPLLIASCSAYVLVQLLGRGHALYAHTADFASLKETGLCLLLALIAAIMGRFWVWLLNTARNLLNGKPQYLVPRMVAAGLLVGTVAVWEPAIVGNGQEAISALIAGQYSAGHMAALLGIKMLVLAIVFGVGTMGGIITPTILVGCFIGAIFGEGVHAMGLGNEPTVSYAFVGLAAFFAVAARAPVTALILAIELTMNATFIFPLMLSVAVAYAFAHLLPGRSLYDTSSKAHHPSAFEAPLGGLRVGDIARRAPMRVHAGAPVERVLHILLRHPGENVPVTDAQGGYLGLIPASAATEAAAEHTVAVGLTDTGLPTLSPDMSLPQALELFSQVETDSLPVVRPADKMLLGMVSRSELYQTTALILRKELALKR